MVRVVGEEDEELRRVRFFSVNDLSVGWFVPRVADVVESFDPANVPTTVSDLLELHNVQKYLENDFLPHHYTAEQRAVAKAKLPQIRSAVARFFSEIDETNCASVITDVDFGYHSDLLELLGRNRAYERCSPTVMLPVLASARIHLGDMLECRRLVSAYDAEIRSELLSSPMNAEHLVRKYMQKDSQGAVHLPASFTSADARDLLQKYIDSPEANPNYVGLIETAHVNATIGVDARLKLNAKRRSIEMTQKFFEENMGMKMGTEVGLSDTQHEPAKVEMDHSDGMVARLTYSRRWLEETVEYPDILNNFQYLFEFVGAHVLLTLPSYPSQLGVFERFLTTAGKTDYQVGAAFRAIDWSTLLQTRLYEHFLKTQDIDLEDAFRWFFEEYLPEEFGVPVFSFTPSTSGTSYLEKVRHLFVEMESVTNQFASFVENGELDPELLAIASEQVRYKQVPSFLPGKYLYSSGSDEITGIIYAMFSDQSGLTYISEVLKGHNAADLFINNEVSYEDLHEYQRRTVDELIKLGLLENTGTRVRVGDAKRFLILKLLHDVGAANYYHLSEDARADADAMVERGWLVRDSSLLTEAEGQYFNYFLNKVDFTNGPELRNKYLHGSQANADGEAAHFHTYIVALRLMVALIIKINDDFCLNAARPGDSGVESDTEAGGS